MTAPVHDDPPRLERLQTAFRADHTSDDPAADLRALVFVLDAQEALPSFGRLRDWGSSALAPAPGETAVDVGCGTGAVVRVLAQRVGSAGRAVGVEPNAELRQVAAERSASTLPGPRRSSTATPTRCRSRTPRSTSCTASGSGST